MSQAITPVLGILDGDAPSQDMIAVTYGASDAIKWTYISTGHGKNDSHHLYDVQHFTPLRLFGLKFGMCDNMSALRLVQITISTAKYPNGTTRPWQGANDAVVPILPSVVGRVWRAVHAEFGAKARAS